MIVSRPALLVLLLASALWLIGCGEDSDVPEGLAAREPAALARLAVAADSSADRSFFFTDTVGTFFYDALAGAPTDPAMGLTVGGFRVVDGWRWHFAEDSVSVGPEHVAGGVVRPDFAARTYRQADSSGVLAGLLRAVRGPELKTLTETITLAEGTLLVEVADSLGTLELRPAVSDRRGASDYTAQAEGNALLIARANYLEPKPGSARPVWLAVAATDGTVRVQAEAVTGGLGVRERGTVLGAVRFPTPGAVAFATGNTPDEAASRARRSLGRRDAMLAQRAERLVSVLERPTIRTEDEDFNRALDWARLSLEELVTEDSTGLRLASGLPGTDAPVGRSTLAALDGAFLATGEWERARRLLTTFGRAQRRDRRIDRFGRIPNEFADGRPQFTTIDATPLWVGAVGDYLRTTGDRSLITDNGAEFWTRTVYAVRGLYDDTASPDGFLSNRPGETWVQPFDGRGRTPRANRVAEAQGRFYRALRAMQPVALIMGQISGRPTSAQAYGDSAAALQRRFEQTFVRDDRLADFVAQSGQPDGRPRPSALLALRDLDLDPATERRILQRLTDELAYPYGVSTLPQSDSLFYPYLDAADFYEPGAARYDGTVWTWLSGPLVSLLVEQGAAAEAYEQTEALQRLILDRGVVGAAAENLDAHPHEGETEPDLGGAPVQPWTLAEFIRNAYQDYAGIRYRSGNTVVLEPHLPDAWGETTATFRLGDGQVRARMAQSAGELTVSLVPSGRLPRGATVRVRGFGQMRAVPLSQVQGDTLVVPLDSVSVTLTPGAVAVGEEEVPADSSYAVPEPLDVAFAEPNLRAEYPVMRQVKRSRVLGPAQVSRTNPLAVPILSRTDPDGDDWGTTATYTYPTSIPARVLDVGYLEITQDDSTQYVRMDFADLADPAAVGFQPTFVALAFDTEEDGGKTEVGRNASYTFPRSNAYEFIVFVGDGVRIEDAKGRVLGEFGSMGSALASAAEGTIRFSVPKFVLPTLKRGTTVTLLVGANDESGDIGAFRSVRERADAGVGGGKVNEGDPNVYDVLNARVES